MSGRKTQIPWSKNELYKTGAARKFKGRQLDEIAFPLGGIGTGCISLGGWGQLRDWEIFGRPAKGNINSMSFCTLNARPKGGKPVTKVLQGPAGGGRCKGGTGSHGRCDGSGLSHFRHCEFTGSFPFATLDLEDSVMPLKASLCAWNPFIPLNDKDSSIPCAIFQWTITNPKRTQCDGTLFMNMNNMTGFPEVGRGKNSFKATNKIRGLEYTTKKHTKKSPRYGTMALTTPHKKVSYLTRWYRAGWFDALTDFWAQAETGKLDTSVKPMLSEEKTGEIGSIGLEFSLRPGESKELTIILTWHKPVYDMYWAGSGCSCSGGKDETPAWKNYCATQWKDAWDVAEYVSANLSRLKEQTALYEDAMRSTTLPAQVIEAITSTSSILKSPTCIRLTGGEFWAWEGCCDTLGCCAGTCTHVWNYQQMLPYLFPKLERSIRETDYANNLHDDGHMTFRMPLPLGTPGNPKFHAATDGQLGGIMKVYRDWRISGDDAWLKSLWPAVKKSLEYAWVNWDADRDGVMEGVQHNTYDIEFWGPNTLCGSFYLGALRAAEKMARRLGDDESAETYAELFRKGSEWSDKNLFNGEYYIHRINLDAGKGDSRAKTGMGQKSKWEKIVGPKYQYGVGCLSDQLLGQYFAHILELGDLYNSANIDKTVDSIFKYNWKRELFDHANPQRIYAQSEEQGLILCSWPRGGKERFPLPYSAEVWTGFEYSTAALLAYRGRIDEALAIVKGARNRHDGTRRNPYDEFECGHHYARAMSSYALLLALSGFVADMPNRRIGFAPKINKNDFRSFFSVDSGWGVYSQKKGSGKFTHVVEIRYGALRLKRLSLPWFGSKSSAGTAAAKAVLGKVKVKAEIVVTDNGVDVVFGRVVNIKKGQPLSITLKKG